MIDFLKEEDAPLACDLFNRSAQSETVYKKLSYDEFFHLFLSPQTGIHKMNMAAKKEDGSVIGFANGCIKEGKNIGYITFIVVDSMYRRLQPTKACTESATAHKSCAEFPRPHVGAELLAHLEQALAAVGNINRYQIIFWNPLALTWIVPGTGSHDHPNAPGVDVSGNAYLFFKNHGYLDTVYQNSFYLPLSGFQMQPAIQILKEELPTHGLSVCFYDAAVHHGMKELLDNLGNDDWTEKITENLAREDGGYPLVIASHFGQVVGFAGPIHVQESGRGYFAGIGVHSDFRQYKLGKILFSSLCQSLKDLGAEYMTLFTGETNPARYIYQSAGFKIVKTWADMEKLRK